MPEEIIDNPDMRRYVHSFDTTAAWLAAAQGTELGVGPAVHRDRPDFDPRLPGLWDLRRGGPRDAEEGPAHA